MPLGLARADGGRTLPRLAFACFGIPLVQETRSAAGVPQADPHHPRSLPGVRADPTELRMTLPPAGAIRPE